ncbi:nonribosomal siderophore peptide synthase Sid2 [Aspergillus heteromorphus CBS 117.55]|uniref:Nonribosomal siderophore peptide synthase Sid2 n=1 Tax=Aspergillus heteromorphus CBS 117.55 TaxID=1448321 RepID=A0A317WPI7_9EURO|nr:nonribosomal siderophore peptide synthase Sid2 [Aspergillus heteromorphus CBS 117.55]PWY86798.1 nonribosomal siderophore peptide synthase Sid2 [Aspergillus heteromorphus CBS 117.55]
MAGLASDQTPTRMKEEIVLLAWLIVLLRTREDGQVEFEWAYDDQQPTKCVSTEVLAGLQSSVGEAADAIARHVAAAASRPVSASSIVLSTGSLSQSPGEGQDEGTIHLTLTYTPITNTLTIHPTWTTPNTLPYTITRHITRLHDTLTLLLSPDINTTTTTIQSTLRPTPTDLSDLWTWNHVLPPTYDFCTNTLITERAHSLRDKPAIDSWDGTLTYSQIERYSTHVALALKDLGLQQGDFVPICFEKSRWTIVAVLAVMKAGGTFALMDPTLPLARLQNMAVQVSAQVMISSRGQAELSRDILPEGKFFVVEEEAFPEGAVPRLEETPQLPPVPADTLMYLIFTSGSTGTPKGVQISHKTYTSSAIPRAKAVGYTEDSRVLDFASYAFDVSIDSMLLTLSNGGCLCIPSDEDRLNDINGVIRNMRVNYAGITPSVARILEPDVIASLAGLGLGGEAASARDVTLWGKDTRIIIGYGPCECTIGCTVNGDTATGRDYISIGTGNGAVIWIVDPSDHEKLMPVGAVGELLVEGPIVGQGYLGDADKTAAAFIEDPAWLRRGAAGFAGRKGRLYKTGDLGKYDPDGSAGIVFAGRKDTQVKLRGQRVELGEIESQLKGRLPADVTVIAEVIVPQGTGGQATLIAFVASQSVKAGDITAVEFPEALRRTLADADAEVKTVLPRYMVPTAYIPVSHIPFGATVDLRLLDQDAAATTADRALSDETLKLQPDAIRPHDNFFALGGDSLAAMRLASVCRAQGLDLSVANTFGHPTLSAMAGCVRICDVDEETGEDSACREAAELYGFDQQAIEDIYPCTPTQESLFTFSLKSVKAYVAQRVSTIPSDVDLDDWKKAWEAVAAAIPILRTRVAQLQEPGLQQIVLKEGYLEADRAEKMNLGDRLARYAIVSQPDGTRCMVWTVHHKAQMRDFVQYEFWRRELKGAVGPQFPGLPSRDYLPIPDALIEHQIPLDTVSGSPFTLATLIRGAWALVSSQYTGNDDVVFGETLTGRDISLAGVDSIVGPLIATVPVRIHIHRAGSVESFLQAHMGMQHIRKAPTGLVVQPDPEYVGSELGFQLGDVVREALHFNPYPLMLACGIRKGGLVAVPQMERILVQLEMAISCLPEAELNQIWRWNSTPPLSVHQNRLRADEGIKQGQSYPPVVVPWVCDPRNPVLLSPIGCVGELWLEGGLAGDTVESPVWLLAGSSSCAGRTGRVQATGDLVQLTEDNSLVFVGRKENVVSVQGHPVNIADIEAQFAKHLPSNIRASAAVSHTEDPQLLVFIEQPVSDGNDIALIPSPHEILCAGSQPFEATICATIPVTLAVALRKLDKFITDSLPSYMAPSAYVIIDRLLSHALLTQLATAIPMSILSQLRDGFKSACTASSVQTTLTPNEKILQMAWAKVLRLTPEQIDVDDNFFRLGGDSVLAMKLVSSLRSQGHSLSVADIFQRMRLGDAATALKTLRSVPTIQPYKTFSTLGPVDLPTFLDTVRPQLADPAWTITDVLPVTDSQALDIRATVTPPRTSIQYTMLHLKSIDRERLLRACHDLVKRHEILRTVFIAHGTSFLQVVLDNPIASITTHQTTSNLSESVRTLCTADSDSPFPLGSSFVRIFLVEDTDSGESCLVLGLSHALYDGVSLPALLTDLNTLYSSTGSGSGSDSGTLGPAKPFSAYISHTLSPQTQTPAKAYWRDLLTGSALTPSPSGTEPTMLPKKAIFISEPTSIATPIQNSITTATLLTASWALLLARTLHQTDLVFGAVTSGRTPHLPLSDIEDVNGPCYALTPVRVAFEPGWTALDLLKYVQGQSATSSSYDFLGFEKISEQCGWTTSSVSDGDSAPASGYFGSIVHHQDWDDADSMSFGGKECGVDLLTPAGDSAQPMKVVSFVKAGVVHVGVVGWENEGEDKGEFVRGLVRGLSGVVEELAVATGGDGLLRFE